MPAPETGAAMAGLLVTVAGASLFFGCGDQPGERQDRRAGPSVSVTTDSLVLSNAAGAQVWFTLARSATNADGHACVERGLEIRSAGNRVKVPLLYTGTAPVLVNDSTMRAILWTHCRAGDTYLVNLRTGQPLREGADHP